jgi:uncharacterized protein with GYD domain
VLVLIVTREAACPRTSAKATYSAQGLRGVVDGGDRTARVEAVQQQLGSAEATLESLYFAFGGSDVYVTFDAQDTTWMATIALTIGTSGAFTSVETIALLTPEEIDEAARRTVPYRPPGPDHGDRVRRPVV